MYYVTDPKALWAETAAECAEDSLPGASGLRPWCLAVTVHGASSHGAQPRGPFPDTMHLIAPGLCSSHTHG